jgi:hypothetical protein
MIRVQPITTKHGAYLPDKDKSLDASYSVKYYLIRHVEYRNSLNFVYPTLLALKLTFVINKLISSNVGEMLLES